MLICDVIQCVGDSCPAVDAYLIVYSVTDRASFTFANSCLEAISRHSFTSPVDIQPVVILVANKQDLVRNRLVLEHGKYEY